MSDEIIEELWQIKDRIAQEHGYDLDTLVAHLQAKERPKGQPVVELPPCAGKPADRPELRT